MSRLSRIDVMTAVYMGHGVLEVSCTAFYVLLIMMWAIIS